MNDIQKFSNTEILYTKQFGGTHITDSRQWEIDADVLTPDGKTVSIKDQLASSGKYGNIAVEAQTSNPDNGKTKDGWLHYIGTTGFATLCVHPKTKEAIWIRCTPAKLQAFVKQHEKTLRKYKLMPWTIEHNRKQGRTYVDGWGYLISVQALLDAGFSFTVLNQQYNT
jgi:hypothetical protein